MPSSWAPSATKLRLPQEEILDSEAEFLILASDGLWDVLSNQDAVQLIRDMVRKDNDCEGAAAKLAKEAINRGSNDNVSCVVIRFNF